MATRHQARMAVVSMLYAYDAGNTDTKNQVEEILEEKKIRNKQKEFALSLLNGVLENLENIDKTIVKNLKDWDYDRLGSIERSVLRLGAYEILYTELDPAIIIDEAVEITKSFAAEKSPKFINGVLDAISKEVKKNE